MYKANCNNKLSVMHFSFSTVLPIVRPKSVHHHQFTLFSLGEVDNLKITGLTLFLYKLSWWEIEVAKIKIAYLPGKLKIGNFYQHDTALNKKCDPMLLELHIVKGG